MRGEERRDLYFDEAWKGVPTSKAITLGYSSRRRQHNTTRTANTEEKPFSTLERVSETTLNSGQHKDNISGE